MKSFATLSVLAYFTAAIKASDITSVFVTQSEFSTTEVTITSCSDHLCTPSSTILPSSVDAESYIFSETTSAPVIITTTIDDEVTSYTTYCPENTTSIAFTSLTPIPSLTSLKADEYTEYPSSSATETDIYVDETITPTVTASSAVEATATAGYTFTSIYNSSSVSTSASAPNSVIAYEGSGNRVTIGAALGFAPLIALLL